MKTNEMESFMERFVLLCVGVCWCVLGLQYSITASRLVVCVILLLPSSVRSVPRPSFVAHSAHFLVVEPTDETRSGRTEEGRELKKQKSRIARLYQQTSIPSASRDHTDLLPFLPYHRPSSSLQVEEKQESISIPERRISLLYYDQSKLNIVQLL